MAPDFCKENQNRFVYIFEDCRLVKGFARTSICDLSRKRIFFISNSFYELSGYFKTHTVSEILDILNGEESRILFYEFLSFLLDEGIACLVEDITCFPDIPVYWDNPSEITNAIIDIRHECNHLDKVFGELAELRCQYLQLRFYKEADRALITQIVGLAKGRCFKDIELIIKYWSGATVHQFLSGLCEGQRNVRFLVHSAPATTLPLSNKTITYTEQCITSCSNCGIINPYTLRIPSIQGYMENRLFNSCLNRKIAVDEKGYIKNCPSMKKSFGNVADTSLVSVARRQSFKRIGSIAKDGIDTCKDCEFRYLCSDCRAYTENDSLIAKPSKCNYDPYQAKWG